MTEMLTVPSSEKPRYRITENQLDAHVDKTGCSYTAAYEWFGVTPEQVEPNDDPSSPEVIESEKFTESTEAGHDVLLKLKRKPLRPGWSEFVLMKEQLGYGQSKK